MRSQDSQAHRWVACGSTGPGLWFFGHGAIGQRCLPSTPTRDLLVGNWSRSLVEGLIAGGGYNTQISEKRGIYMKVLPMGCMRLALLLVLMIELVACDSKQEQPAVDASGQTAKAEAVSQLSIEELPDRNIDDMDVCALLPGSALASALNLPLLGTESGPGMCSYALRGDSGEARFDVILTSNGIFLFTRNTSENVKDVPGFGVAAYTRKASGINQDLWVARKDGLFFHVAAYDPDVAEPVARVALDTIP